MFPTTMARIAITGSCGLIGGLVFDTLSQHGHEVVGIDRPHEDRISRGRNVDDEGAYSRLTHSCDLAQTSEEDLTKWFADCQVVIHLAADADPSNMETSMLETNICSTHNVLKAAISANVDRVILASSGLAQVTLERRLDNDISMIGVEHGVGIDTPYGLTKIIGEQLGKRFAKKHGLEVVSVRIGTVVPDDSEHFKRGGRLMATAFLSDDVKNFFLSTLTANLDSCNGHLITAAQSDSPTRFIDLEPGVSILGWKPIEWPSAEVNEE